MSLQGKTKQKEAVRLSPLFVDTEFVPIGMQYFTLYNRQLTNIPTVLPYSNEQTFQQLQAKLSKIKSSSSSKSSIKDYKIQTCKKRIDGVEYELNADSQLIEMPMGRGSEWESRERCDICCIMLASKEEVIHLSVRRKNELAIRADIVAELNRKYEIKLKEDDIQFNLLSFSCQTQANITNIRYIPTPIESISDSILRTQEMIFIGIDIVTNRFQPAKFIQKKKEVISIINPYSNRMLRFMQTKQKWAVLEYERIKQYQVREVLGMLGVKNAQSRGVKVMDKIFEPNEVIYSMGYLFDETGLINFIDVTVVGQREVFLQGIGKFPALSEIQIKKIVQEDSKQRSSMRSSYNMRTHASHLGLFCSESQIHSNKQTSFNFLFHIINKYIRNYFTHFNNFFDDSISSRFAKGLYQQLKGLPSHEGTVFRWVGYQLNHQEGDIIQFSSFIVTTINQKLLNLNNGPLYDTSSTIVKLVSKTGRMVNSHFSSFSKLQEVVFLPFTSFRVIQRYEDKYSIHLTLEQVSIQESASSSNIVLWVDNNLKEGQNMFNKIKCLPSSIHLYQLTSTLNLSEWISSHQKCINSKSNRIILITNMRRYENGKDNPNAGIQTIQTAKKYVQKATIIVYIGSIQHTKNNLRKNQINPDTLYVVNQFHDLMDLLIQEFNFQENQKKKQKKQEQILNKIEKQDWEDYFSVIKENPSPKKEEEKYPLKEPYYQKQGISVVGGLKQQKSPPKDNHQIPQEKKIEIKESVSPSQKKFQKIMPHLIKVESQNSKGQKQNAYEFGQMFNKPSFQQPVQPKIPQSTIISGQYDDADRFAVEMPQKPNIQKTNNQSNNQSNLYKITDLKSKVMGSSTVPLKSPKSSIFQS